MGQDNSTADIGDFVPVAVETLRSGSNFDFDLYLPPEGHKAAKLYRRRSVPCTAEDFSRLLMSGVETLWISSDMSKSYREHIKKYVLNDETIPIGQRLQVLKEAAKTTFWQAMKTCDGATITNVADDFSKDLTQLLTRQDFLLSDLVTVMLHDYSTYTHMTHVATYSVLLAKNLGGVSATDLIEVAKGGLLHDIGKRFISVKILEKPGKLDDEEFGIIRDHPRFGFAELCFRPEFSWGALMMIYQHHERMNGSGYPVGSVAEEIHPWGKICAIADVYDAMTSKRSYHSAAGRREVLDYFQKQAGMAFDKEMVQCFHEIMQPTLLPT
jgi:HD-GYP domain-containing protein (c-di-GMP phosphodiesterase class II)